MTTIRILLYISLASLALFMAVDWVWFLMGELHTTAATKPWFASAIAALALRGLLSLQPRG
jgi:hypothetical protein